MNEFIDSNNVEASNDETLVTDSILSVEDINSDLINTRIADSNIVARPEYICYHALRVVDVRISVVGGVVEQLQKLMQCQLCGERFWYDVEKEIIESEASNG